MPLTEIFSSFYATLGIPELHAEAPPEEESEEGEEESGSKDEKEEGEGEGGEEGGEEEGEGGDEEGGEEEEEEEEEVEDPKPKLEEECARSSQCISYKHHFDECAERVTKQHENPNHKGPKEDCVEEFFHLQHCATQCAAPKLFRMLK